MLFTNGVSCVHPSPVNDPFCGKVATATCGILMGSTSLVNVPSQNIDNDIGMSDLFEIMIRSPMIT